MDEPNSIACEVIRVTRPNTLLIRTLVDPIQSNAKTYAVLAGVRCRQQSVRQIND